MSLVERLSRYYDSLSPHIKERKTAGLLNEAREELVRLQTENALFKSALEEVSSCPDGVMAMARIADKALGRR